MEQSTLPGELARSASVERQQLVKDTIQSFVELVMIQKFADMPGWIDTDLTVSQVRAIYFLAAHGQLTVSDLSRLLEIGRPAASILVQQLVEQQWVERTEDSLDRRRSWVSLTARGSGLVSGRREQREKKFRRWLGQLDDEELACLRVGISALLEVVRRSRP
jgi:DNA-binding MarR family transcriptional regulator